MNFQIKIADQIVSIHSQHRMVYDLCSGYVVRERDKGLKITIRQGDIDFERSQSQKEGPPENFSDGYLETLAVYRQIVGALLERDILLVHGSVIGYGTDAVMISAPSGVGKTTFSDLCLQAVADTYILNGDKPLISVSDSGIKIYGTPWCGKENLNRNSSAVLKSICFLQRGDANEIHRLSAKEAFPLLLGQAYRPNDAAKMSKTVKLLSALANHMDFYRITLKYYPTIADMKHDTAALALETMTGCLQGSIPQTE